MEGRHSESGFTVVFEALDAEAGLDIVDPIERRRRTLETPAPVAPEPIDTAVFPVPVETAVEIETERIALQTAEQVLVRDDEGQMLEEVEHGERRTLPPATYVLEPTNVVHAYLWIEGAVTIGPDGHGTELDFGGPTRVGVGCRSTHERPAATVTVTPDPADVLDAISTFGSALKTTTPERAFPSFRGHPPAIEVGSERSIPEELAPPADDLRIEVPAEYRSAFPVAPLAFYLGAPVVEGPAPRLVGPGIDRPLDREGDLVEGVRLVLEHVFLLDCVARTEGLYRIDLHERAVLDERLDLDWERLYHAPQHERLQAYLEVPRELIADQIPDWQHAAHVEPAAASVEALPYLVDDLSLIRTTKPSSVSASVVESGGVQGLLRGAPSARGGGGSGGTGPTGGASAAVDASFVDPGSGPDAIEETWVGDGTPIGATKAVTAAFENRIGRSPTTGDIDIGVVANADELGAEGDLVDEVYGSRANLPFDVTVHRQLTTDELADVLAEPRDFLHYVGHIEPDGFRCSDGLLDVGDLDEVGADAFFLNACKSYDQGMALIEQGAIGGIVTIRDVVDHGAVRIGRTVARLLNAGFPLKPALEIARDESVVGSLYTVAGDGGLSIVQTAGGTPILDHVSTGGEGYSVRLEFFGAEDGLGGVCIPHIDEFTQYHLASSSTPSVEVDREALFEYVSLEQSPIVIDGDLSWPEELGEGSL